MLRERKYQIAIALLLVLIITIPSFSVVHDKWAIVWDTVLLQEKKDFTSADQQSQKENPPNIVLIVCDDLGKYEVSAYGVDHIQTPHIDRIGHEGVIFQEAYSTSPICAPSRAGILTGRVQNRFGFETQIVDYYPANRLEYLGAKYLVNMDSWELTSEPEYPNEEQHAKQGIPPSEINLAEYLKSYGYQTAITGKWHLGYGDDFLPLQRGFDEQYGFYGAFSWYTPEREIKGIVNYEHDHFGIQHQWDMGRSENGAIRANGQVVEEEQYLTFAIRDKAIDFIDQHQDQKNPFFLYCTFSAPHIPFQAPQDYYDRFAHVEDDNKRVYYAMISALDDAIGAIHQRIIDLGIEENTLIVVVSDNGGATYTEATDNGPLKGGKTTQFEGGINVPMVMKWKGTLHDSIHFEAPVMTTDIFTTVASAVGGALPQKRTYDGVDLLPYLNMEKEGIPHENLFWRAGHIWAVRSGDYKMIRSDRDGWAELYNLKDDKSESINLLEIAPEKYQELYQLHQKWQQEQLPARPLWPNIVDFKIEIDGQTYFFPS